MTAVPDIPPTVRALAYFVRGQKNRSVRHADGQIPHVVDVYRRDRLIVRVAVPTADDCLSLVYNTPGALTADYLVMGIDAWIATGAINPVTGKRWQFGDMDTLAHDAAFRSDLTTGRRQLLTRDATADRRMRHIDKHDAHDGSIWPRLQEPQPWTIALPNA